MAFTVPLLRRLFGRADHEKTHDVGNNELHHEDEPEAHADRSGDSQLAVSRGEREQNCTGGKEVGDGGVGRVLELAEDVDFSFVELTGVL